jgi:hypothetical protein
MLVNNRILVNSILPTFKYTYTQVWPSGESLWIVWPPRWVEVGQPWSRISDLPISSGGYSDDSGDFSTPTQVFCCLYFFIGKLASEMFGEVYRNYLNVQLVLSASTDSHASFFSGAWKFVNF